MAEHHDPLLAAGLAGLQARVARFSSDVTVSVASASARLAAALSGVSLAANSRAWALVQYRGCSVV